MHCPIWGMDNLYNVESMYLLHSWITFNLCNKIHGVLKVVQYVRIKLKVAYAMCKTCSSLTCTNYVSLAFPSKMDIGHFQFLMHTHRVDYNFKTKHFLDLVSFPRKSTAWFHMLCSRKFFSFLWLHDHHENYIYKDFHINCTI